MYPPALLRELRALIDRHADRAPLAVGGLMLSRADRPEAPSASLARPVLAVVAQGSKRLTLGDRVHDYGAGQYLVVSVDLPVAGHYTRASPEEPFLACGFTLEPAKIAALLLEAGTDPLPHRTAPHGLAVCDAPAELLDATVRLLRLLDRPGDAPVLAPLIEKEILWRLITGEQGALVRQIGLADSQLTHIGRAIRWIRDHHTETLRIEDLARLAGMSASPFHRHFRAVTALTPIQFQKRIRLQEARLMLLSSAADVADVGFAVGYDSASQFSREYRRAFGRPPGQDAVRLRSEVAGTRP
ncbi:AraC family transcriptional regulator [Streptomyces sp. W16]|uniref:AraC family transcriptional regulator n=1 Tax=Streptomyces sp. W16 TaxID=3076631 RepID=UPI00295AB0C1|nr:AraC family transcriptional regulator [Streptomyces sp. W16]MDV9178111.1 AraC family transcriptional regulator [Streptomyces sp. W16]